jgi:acetyltransferase
MTTRNLDALFEPKAIALVGASNQPGSVGAVLARNLFDTGFAGPILAVNPHELSIRSALSYHTVAELPVTPDMAVVATPPPAVPGLIAELGQRGCRAAVVVTAGFGEGERAEGTALRQAMLDAARPHLLRIVGPNCLGFISPGRGINASFAHLTPPTGDIAFVTQSGAIATTVLDWAAARGFGFSHVVSLGDMADVDFGDLLDYLSQDQKTRAILLYVESVTQARKFMSAARIAARAKPVIVIKSGRSAAGAKAALSHTGALAGSDLVYDAAFRRAGMLRVYELRELFDAVTTLSSGVEARGDRLSIITNGGGLGVMATDALEEFGGRLAGLAPATMAKLNAVLPPTWSRANPVDILGDANGSRYASALEAVLADTERDAILIINCPTAVADSGDAAEAVIKTLRPSSRVPVLTCWVGETAVAESRRHFVAKRVPTYETPSEAVRGFMHLVHYRQNQELLLETPPSTPVVPIAERAGARRLIVAVLKSGRSVLTEPEAKSVLAAYDIPTVATRTAADPAEAGRVAADLTFPVVIKILSEQISHKSDVGGVHLDLSSAEAVEEAAREMLAAVQSRVPTAKIDGFTVEVMARRSDAQELLVGIGDDATFGPVILFGHGGTAAEVIGDRAIGLPPLNMVLAREMIGRTRIARLLKGYRDRPPVAIDAIALTLVRLSELAIDLPEVVELDINPLLADAAGVLALDARIVVRTADGRSLERLSIRPYPDELRHEITLASGLRFVLRPIRPEDEPRLVEMATRCSPEDLRSRFFGRLKEFPHMMAARLSQIDYSREMALIATNVPEVGKEEEMFGVVRLIADPENENAEFAVMVRSDLQGQGLGTRLMTELMAYARANGLRTLSSEVLRSNSVMTTLARELGFTTTETDSPEVVRVTIGLSSKTPV